MPAVIVRHTVADFDTWLAAFEAHAPARAAIGAEKAMVWQEAGDPNTVVVLIKVGDLGRAAEFLGSEDTKQAMAAAGVTGEPQIMLVDNGRKFDH